MTVDSTLEFADKHIFWHSSVQMADYAQQSSVIMKRGAGYRLWDHHDQEYIDANSGVWCVNLGYSETRIISAIADQLGALPYTSLSAFSHEPAIKLASKLATLAHAPGGHVLFATSGAEAVEASVKLARQFFRQNGEPNRQFILSLKDSYHGLTVGALSVTGLETQRKPYAPFPETYIHAPAPACFRCAWGESYPGCGLSCLQALMDAVSVVGADRIAAIIVEPVLASGGMHVLTHEYMQAVERYAKSIGALLVVDEVTSGMGRTGRMLFHEFSGIRPDIVLLSKGLTGGYQALSAILVSARVFEGFLGDRSSGRAFLDFHTFGGHPAACAAALAVLQIFETDRILDNVAAAGRRLAKGLSELQADLPAISHIRGLGLMYGIEFGNDTAPSPSLAERVRRIPRHAMRHGLIVRSLRDAGHVLCVFPPLIIDSLGVDALVSRLGQAIREEFGDAAIT